MEETIPKSTQAALNAGRVAAWAGGVLLDKSFMCDYPDNVMDEDAIIVLSCGRFSPDGPDGATTPDEVQSVEETDECRDRVRFGVETVIGLFDPRLGNQKRPALVLNAATQQIPMMERWTREALSEYGEQAQDVEVIALGKTPFPYANTKTQFQDLSELALARGWKSLVIMTSDYHIARCYLYFKHLDPMLHPLSGILSLNWVVDNKVDTQTAVKLIAGEVQRCMLYTATGDLGFPWELGWEA